MQRTHGWKYHFFVFWAFFIMSKLLLSSLSHFLILLTNQSIDESPNNVTLSHSLSSLTHQMFPEDLRLAMKSEARSMFYFAYNNYLTYAFPHDELDPIHCKGRGHDWSNPSNININDVLGDYSLSLIESLDTLVVMGDVRGFKEAVDYIRYNVSFNSCSTVQVFEATIRILGSLLSAHLIITDPSQKLGDFSIEDYDNELLYLAHDLATRLLPAFDNSITGIPHPRVNLCHGLPSKSIMETCTAGAGTLTLEFILLSRLLDDPVYEGVARKAVRAIWDRRHPWTGLVGNVINLQDGNWVGSMSGIGAGIDSFYEYLLKSYILYGEREDLEMFSQFYSSIMTYMRKGSSCTESLMYSTSSNPPFYVNVEYSTGKLANYWMDSLSASFAGLQVLAGDIDEAICTHALYYTLWRKYDALPERFDWKNKVPLVSFYPLRPELIESTYFLYQATHNPFYLHVGVDILNSIQRHGRARCGYATLHDVSTKTQEDRMESFFLSETCKYLYLLFDVGHPLNTDGSNYIFTTEGHIIPLDSRLSKRHKKGKNEVGEDDTCWLAGREMAALARVNETHIASSCKVYNTIRKHYLPLSRRRLAEIEDLIRL